MGTGAIRNRSSAALRIGSLAAIAMGATLGLARPAEATTTRVYTLGAMNRFILDDTNRWLYPHIITKYGNLFYVELFGSSPSRSTSAPTSNRQSASTYTLDIADTVPVQQTAGGGAIIGLTDDIFLSLHLSDYEDPTVPQMLAWLASTSGNDPRGFPWIPDVAPESPQSANRKLDMFLAYNLQDMVQLGLQLSYGSSSYSRNPNDNDPDVVADLQGNVESRKSDSVGTSAFSFLLSGGLAIGDAATIDAGLGMTFHSLKYRPNERGDLIDGGGGIEFQADVRAMIGVTEWWEVVPALSLRTRNLKAADLANYGNGLTYNNAETGREDYFITDAALSQLIFDMGVAGHFKPTDGIHFWGAVGFEILNVTQKFEHLIAETPDNGNVRTDQNLEYYRDAYAYSAVPYFRLAVEARVFSWLDFRGGVVKYMLSEKVTEDRADDNNSDFNRLNDISRDTPYFDYFIGFAAHYEGFFLDMQLDPLWFNRGPEFLSGASGSGGGNMFVNASLGYRF